LRFPLEDAIIPFDDGVKRRDPHRTD